MKKILALVVIMFAVFLAGCGSNLKSDKPLSAEGYNKESMVSDDISVGMRFNGTDILAGTYEGKDKNGKNIRLASMVTMPEMTRTRTPATTLVKNSSVAHVYKNGDIYHVVFSEKYMALHAGETKTLQQHDIMIVDKGKKTAALFINVRDDGSYDKTASGELKDFRDKDLFTTLKLENPFKE